MSRFGLSFYQARYWFTSYGEWPIYPFCWEEAVRERPVDFRQERGEFLLINLILEGNLEYHVKDGGSYRLSQGDILLIPEHYGYRFLTLENPCYRKVALEIKGTLLERICEKLKLNAPLRVNHEDARVTAKKIMELGAFFQNNGDESVAEFCGRTWDIMMELGQIASRESKEPRFLASARSLLEQNLSHEFSIAELAAKLGVSHVLLTRRFREQHGITPQRYRTNCRIDQAKYLLKHTLLPIKDIAFRVGYANALYFSNDFKKRCGLSPKHYREEQPEA